MSGVRWAILILGAVAVLGVYLHWRLTRGERTAEADPDDSDYDSESIRREPALEPSRLAGLDAGQDAPRREPVLDPEPAAGAAAPGSGGDSAGPPAGASQSADSREEQARSGADETEQQRADGEKGSDDGILVVHVAARGEERMRGEDIVRALNRHGLAYTPEGVFYRYGPGGEKEGYLFGAANMLEPGTFDITEMENLRTIGIVLFSALPRALPATEVAEDMLATARELADELDGELLDRARSPLGEAGIAALRDRAARFDAGS